MKTVMLHAKYRNRENRVKEYHEKRQNVQCTKKQTAAKKNAKISLQLPRPPTELAANRIGPRGFIDEAFSLAAPTVDA